MSSARALHGYHGSHSCPTANRNVCFPAPPLGFAESRAFLPTVELYDTAAGIVHPLLGISSTAGHVDAGATAGAGAGAGAGSGAGGEVSKATAPATKKQVEERGMLEAAEFQALARAWPAACRQAAHGATVLAAVRT